MSTTCLHRRVTVKFYQDEYIPRQGWFSPSQRWLSRFISISRDKFSVDEESIGTPRKKERIEVYKPRQARFQREDVHIYVCVCVRKRIIAKFMDTNPISTAWTAKRIYISSARDRQRSSSPLKRIYLAGAKFRERPRNSRLRQVYTAAQFDENPSADRSLPLLSVSSNIPSRANRFDSPYNSLFLPSRIPISFEPIDSTRRKSNPLRWCLLKGTGRRQPNDGFFFSSSLGRVVLR